MTICTFTIPHETTKHWSNRSIILQTIAFPCTRIPTLSFIGPKWANRLVTTFKWNKQGLRGRINNSDTRFNDIDSGKLVVMDLVNKRKWQKNFCFLFALIRRYEISQVTTDDWRPTRILFKRKCRNFSNKSLKANYFSAVYSFTNWCWNAVRIFNRNSINVIKFLDFRLNLTIIASKSHIYT